VGGNNPPLEWKRSKQLETCFTQFLKSPEPERRIFGLSCFFLLCVTKRYTEKSELSKKVTEKGLERKGKKKDN